MLIQLNYPDGRLVEPEVFVRRAYMSEIINSDQLDKAMDSAIKEDWPGILDVFSPGWRDMGIPNFIALPFGIVAEVL